MMRIALYQSCIIWENKQENLEKARIWIQKAVTQGADIIFLPEMSFTGFSMNIEKTKEMVESNELLSKKRCFKTEMESETIIEKSNISEIYQKELFNLERDLHKNTRKKETTISYIQKLAKENQCIIGFGWVRDHMFDKKAENHYTIIDKEGKILSDYIKIHPFSYSGEHNFFVAGDHISLCQVQGFTMSTFLCYDLRFPELFQRAAEKAQLIVVAANWPEVRREHWISLLKARAIETQTYFAAVNCVGVMDNISYSGDSLIISPTGVILQELKEEEGLILYQLENNIQQIREQFPMRKDRRNDYYQLMYDCKK